jgi:hypothetical protein
MYPLLGLYMFDRFQRQNRLKLQLLAELANRIPQEEPEFDEGLFNLDTWQDSKIRRYLRFGRDDIYLLAQYFELESMPRRNRYRKDSVRSLCVTLMRLAYPGRLLQLQDFFGLDETTLSRIYNDTVDWLVVRFGYLLYWHPMLDFERLDDYSEAINAFGGVTQNKCWGFVDGTFRATCRPLVGQRDYYTGHKKLHGFKYQAIVAPDGLCVALWGPFEGKRNDVYMGRRSEFESKIRNICHGQRIIRLVGDSAYQSFRLCVIPFLGRRTLSISQTQFNKHLSSIRISVENFFGQVMEQWKYLGYRTGLRIGQSPVASSFEVGVLLSNCYTCMYSNTIGSRFGIDAPTIEEYLQIGNRPI